MKRGEVCGQVSDCQLVMEFQAKDGNFIENVWKKSRDKYFTKTEGNICYELEVI